VPEYLAPGVYAEEKEISAKPIEGVSTSTSTARFLGDAERGTIKKYSLERNITKLSFAISLLDDYSKGKPIGRVDVSLKARIEKPVKNLSSYYLFLNLSDGTYTVQVKSDYYFDEDSDPIMPSQLDPKNPIVYKYLFSIGAEFEDELNNGIISDELRDKFETEGFPISETAGVTNEKEDKWVITDREKKYIVKKEEGVLNMYANITLKPKPSYPFPPGATLIRGNVYDSAGEAVSGAKVRVKGKDVENKTTEEGEFVLYFGPLTEDEIIRVDGKRFVKGDVDKTLYLEVEYEGVTEPKVFEAEEGKITSVIIN
jgi:hypothetical protein